MEFFQTLVIFFVTLGGTNVFGGNATQQEPWIEEAVLDVAFSLRRHKFQANDLRYRSGKSIPLYLQFPDPPLRKTHWQVARHCEKSFKECLKYLWDSLKRSSLTRETNPFTQHSNLSITDRNAKNKDCVRLEAEDGTALLHLKSPMDKFQWFVTASYYMCWFTYQQEAALLAFTERCDNFGACLDELGLFENEDMRARDDGPFACAIYSFCPDPCCDNRVLTKMEDCKITPCGGSGPCVANPNENKDWDSMINNEWNVTCPCSEFGTRWDSQSGLCIDVDECLQDGLCNPNQNCVNLAGNYKCVCAFGFVTGDETATHCEVDHNLERLFRESH